MRRGVFRWSGAETPDLHAQFLGVSSGPFVPVRSRQVLVEPSAERLVKVGRVGV